MPGAVVAALNLFPVKGCAGIALTCCNALTTGIAHDEVRDREWMLIDPRGRFLTQRELPRLALIRTRILERRLVLDVPGLAPLIPETQGPATEVVVWRARVRGLDGGDTVASALSLWLGRDVRLVRFDDALPRACNPDYAGDSGATTLYSDGYPVLVIGQASLDDLNRRLVEAGDNPLPMNRFRPNLVIDGLDPHDEDHIDTLAIGDAVLKFVKPCVRCEVTTTDQATARRSIEPLRTLSTYRRNDALAGVTFGMNAIVVSGAGTTIRTGDTARVTLRF